MNRLTEGLLLSLLGYFFHHGAPWPLIFPSPLTTSPFMRSNLIHDISLFSAHFQSSIFFGAMIVPPSYRQKKYTFCIVYIKHINVTIEEINGAFQIYIFLFNITIQANFLNESHY